MIEERIHHAHHEKPTAATAQRKRKLERKVFTTKDAKITKKKEKIMSSFPNFVLFVIFVVTKLWRELA